MSVEHDPPLTTEALLRHAAFVRDLARGILQDEQLAEDVLQQACLAAITSPPRHPRHVRAWLRAVVRNLAAKILRGNQRRLRVEAVSARHEAVAADATLESSQAMRAIVEAVLGLDEPYRSTVIRRYYEDQPPRAIAAADGVPVATVNSRLQRALAKLRSQLRCATSWRGIAALAGAEGARSTVIAGGVAMGVKTGVGIAAGIIAIGSLVWLAVHEQRGTRGRELRDVAVAGRDGDLAAPTVVLSTPSPAREVAAAEPEARQPASDAAAARDRHRERALDPVSASFLTSQPDLLGLLEMVRSCAQAATVDAGSVTTEDGVVRGRIALADPDLGARFEIENGHFRVEIQSSNATLPAPFRVCALAIQFGEQDGNPADCRAMVQFHPDTRRAVSEVLADDGSERYVGWGVDVGRDGARAQPISMRRHGKSWVIGKPATLAPIHDRYVQDTTPFQAWLRLLGRHDH